MRATPTRRINPLLRVMMSAVLVAFAIFVIQYKKFTTPAKPLASAGQFLTDSPSSEGSNRFAWVPKYPGAILENISTKQTRDQLTYGFTFHSPDDFKRVLDFYRDQLRSAGYQVDLKESGGNGGEVHAEADGGSRTLDATVAKAQQGAEVGVTAVLH